VRTVFRFGLLRVGVGFLIGIALACLADGARAQNFNQFIAFGDSTIDSGWWQAWLAGGGSAGSSRETTLISNAIANGTNGAPVGAGNLNNSQILASLFGLTAIPADQPNGTNYAVSGAFDAANATTGNLGNLSEVNGGTNAGLPSTVQQITNYLAANGGRANPNALYLISSGGNDNTFAQDNLSGSAIRPYVVSQAQALAAAITNLAAAGARYIVVDNVNLAISNNLGQLQTQTLWGQLQANGVNFIPAHVAAVIAAVDYNPGIFGITSTTQGVTGTNTGSACVWTGTGPTTGWSQWCANTTTPSTSYAYLRSANAEQTSLWADNEHLSAAGQVIEADYVYSLVTAPSEISYLAEAPVKIRTTLVDSIFQQIQVSEQHRAVGSYNAWVSGDISSLSMGNSFPGFPSDPGVPGMVTVGADYMWSSHWLIGGAVSAGTTTQSFSLGGNFKENEYALSAYAAYVGAPWWFDAVATYGGIHDDTNRIVPVGITTVSNTSSTNGNNASFGAEVGYNFKSGEAGWWNGAQSPLPLKAPPAPAGFTISHGPVGGILLQQVYVNGFTETDPFSGDAFGGFTAESFAGQVRDSAVTELGYQAGTDIGLWHPYAKLTWNHELEPYNRLVTATLTTIAAPSYSLPAVILGTDWATATVGASVALSSRLTGYASFTSEVAQSQTTFYSGLVGVSLALGGAPPSVLTK
jgi:outer membrane lipase/esterase